MDRGDYTNAGYDRPHVPPGTPPVIDSAADAGDAATLTDARGGPDSPGSREAHFDRSAEDAVDFDHGSRPHIASGGGGDRYDPGRQPDEVGPGHDDIDMPGRTPDEVAPDQGDFDGPGETPSELPPQPGSTPGETPPPD